MKNYIKQNGCHNCKNRFEKYDYDECTSYYCIHDAKKRPLCLSVGMAEDVDTDENDFSVDNWKNGKCYKAQKEWEEWSEKYIVASWGICDFWSK